MHERSSSPLGRTRAISIVQDGQLPVWLVDAMIVEQDGRFRIRALVVDRRAVATAERSRTPSWMPDHYFALGSPTGEIFADAPSRDELVAQMRTMDWHDDW